jgi:hypothetical protein
MSTQQQLALCAFERKQFPQMSNVPLIGVNIHTTTKFWRKTEIQGQKIKANTFDFCPLKIWQNTGSYSSSDKWSYACLLGDKEAFSNFVVFSLVPSNICMG